MYTVYTKLDCKWCNLAKIKLTEIGETPFIEMKFNVDFTKDQLKAKLIQFNITGEKVTLPQIFKGDTYIGTYEDLIKLLETQDGK